MAKSKVEQIKKLEEYVRQKLDLVTAQKRINEDGENYPFQIFSFVSQYFPRYIHEPDSDSEQSEPYAELPELHFSILIQCLKENESIEHLSLYGVHIRKQSIPIIAELFKDKNLKSVNIHNCFPMEGLIVMIQALANNTHLVSLRTPFNSAVARQMRTTQTLTSLSLAVHPDLFQYFALSLKSNRSLLYLLCNIKTPDGYELTAGWPDFIDALENHPMLQNFEFIASLSGEECEQLALLLERHNRLLSVNLSIDEGGSIEPFAKALLHNRVLNTFILDLKNRDDTERELTNYDPIGMQTIAEALKTNSTLTFLSLHPYIPAEDKDKEYRDIQEICRALLQNQSLDCLILSFYANQDSDSPAKAFNLLDILKPNYRLTHVYFYIDSNDVDEATKIYCERNKCLQRNWASVIFALGWYHANLNHPFQHSFLPILYKHILPLADIQRKATDISLFGIQNSQQTTAKASGTIKEKGNPDEKPAFLDSKYARNIIYSNAGQKALGQSISSSSSATTTTMTAAAESAAIYDSTTLNRSPAKKRKEINP